MPHTLQNAIKASFQELVTTTIKLLDDMTTCVRANSQEKVNSFVTECNTLLQGYGNLFLKSKQEVYLLIREDSYKRWRRTEGFSRFIMDSVKKGK